MEGAERAYERLLTSTRELLPAVADQVQEEVARGLRLQRSQLPAEERDARELRMTEAKVGRKIGKEEHAVVAYSPDERLALLLDALERWVDVGLNVRLELASLAREQDLPPIVRFSNPDELQDQSLHVDLLDTEGRPAVAEAIRVIKRAQSEQDAS